MIKLVELIILLGTYTLATAIPSDVTQYFPEVEGNLTKVTWAHAVNNLTLLDEALKGEVMMLEADIVLGTLNGTNETIPIMGHPPATTSDLSFENFLNRTYQHNAANETSKKGVKLDFKSIDVFEQSIDILQQLYSKIDYPVWINADIIKGPVNASDPVDADVFLQKSKNFTGSTLSIGWTTNYGANVSASYTDDQITEMLTKISNNSVTQPITFPVRAGIAAESVEQMKNLLKGVNGSTLTIWSSDGDNVNVENLRKLILTVGVDNVYIDVPEDLKNQLNLSSTSTGFMNRSLLITLFSMVLFLAVL